MSRQTKNDPKGSLIIPVGWLFADLLLALAMLFLIANTVAPPSKAKSTRTPTPTMKPEPTPSPTPSSPSNILILEPMKVMLRIDGLNPDSLNTGDSGAMSDLESKIRTKVISLHLQKRRAGIAIVYAGANSLDANEVNRATSVAGQVYKVLDMLGQHKFVFCHTVHFDALFSTNIPNSTIIIDVYFFSVSEGGC